jgi:hypothetical protein
MNQHLKRLINFKVFIFASFASLREIAFSRKGRKDKTSYFNC